MRLAQCFMADTATERTLDKMSLHQMRLINTFHKSAKLLLLLGDLREKGLFRANARRRFPDAVYARPEGLPVQPVTAEELAELRDWMDKESRENADRGGVAGAQVVPEGVNAEARAPHPPASAGPSFSIPNCGDGEGNSQTAPTPSSDGQSGENVDRGEGDGEATKPCAVGERTEPFDPEDFQRDLVALEAETNRLRARIDQRRVAK
jgi:hypothetical protein